MVTLPGVSHSTMWPARGAKPLRKCVVDFTTMTRQAAGSMPWAVNTRGSKTCWRSVLTTMSTPRTRSRAVRPSGSLGSPWAKAASPPPPA